MSTPTRKTLAAPRKAIQRETRIRALLAKYYSWPRYGTQQWRQYAMVLAVGFGVGISLIGMVCASVLMVSKSVSSTSF